MHVFKYSQFFFLKFATRLHTTRVILHVQNCNTGVAAVPHENTPVLKHLHKFLST